MTALIRQHSALLRILVIIFTLNSTLGFANCCPMPDQDQQSAEMPCHESDDSSVDVEKCCAACFVMVSPAGQSPGPEVITDNDPLFVPTFISSNLDPPFKPPITQLS